MVRPSGLQAITAGSTALFLFSTTGHKFSPLLHNPRNRALSEIGNSSFIRISSSGVGWQRLVRNMNLLIARLSSTSRIQHGLLTVFTSDISRPPPRERHALQIRGVAVVALAAMVEVLGTVGTSLSISIASLHRSTRFVRSTNAPLTLPDFHIHALVLVMSCKRSAQSQFLTEFAQLRGTRNPGFHGCISISRMLIAPERIASAHA